MTVLRLAATAMLAGALGCTPTNDPDWPFRERPVGPGLERSAGGRLVEVLDGSGDVLHRARFSMTSARFYDESAQRIGRLRPDGERWAVIDRDENVVCTGWVDLERFELACGVAGFEGTRAEDTVTIARNAALYGVVTSTADEVRVEPLGGRVVRCLPDGTIEGAARATALRTGVLPQAGCFLAAAMPVVVQGDAPLVRGALAWLVWRLSTAPAPEATPEGSATGEASGSGDGA